MYRKSDCKIGIAEKKSGDFTSLSLFSNANMATVLSVEPEAKRRPSTFQPTE
jgi:hypothetical protein